MSPIHLPASKTFPHPTSTIPFWRTEPSPLDTYRSTPDLPSEVDIAIIGSGMSGVSIAYHLLKSSSPPGSILLLEARQLCSGATGRNGGHTKLASIHMQKASDLPNGRGGIGAAEELIAFQVRQIQALKNVIEEEGIQCDFLLTRSFDVYLNEELAKERINGVREKVRDGVETARRELQIVEGSGEELERVSFLSLGLDILLGEGLRIWVYCPYSHILLFLWYNNRSQVFPHHTARSIRPRRNCGRTNSSPACSRRSSTKSTSRRRRRSSLFPRRRTPRASTPFLRGRAEASERKTSSLPRTPTPPPCYRNYTRIRLSPSAARPVVS